MSETLLYIDGQRVTLPSNTRFTFIDQNPFLTKNGQYTYDITLSLLDKLNAKIYANIQRSNSVYDLPSKRSAILIVDNRVLLKGTEILVEKSESEVSIQIVSGNSELNYLAGSDLNIRSLDLGWEPLYGASVDEGSSQWLITQMDDPEGYDHFALPFGVSDSEMIGNRWHIYRVSTTQYKIRYSYDGQVKIKDGENYFQFANIRPQPKLAFIAEKILNTLGYSVLVNKIREHEHLKYACIIHGMDTIEWAKMLPSWSVSEFFNQLELLAGCTLVVDNVTNEASILFNWQADLEEIKEIEVLDEYDDEIDTTRRVSTYQKKNIGYSLDSDEYYKLSVVSEDIMRAGEIRDMTDEVETNAILEYLFDAVNDENQPSKFTNIFRTVLGDFITYNDGTINLPKEINFLKPVFNNPDEDKKLDLELKIIPAAMKVVKLPIYVFGEAPLQLPSVLPMSFHMQLPVVEHADVFNVPGVSGEIFKMQDLVSGVDSIQSAFVSDKMRLAFFTGRKTVDAFSSTGAVVPTEYFEPFPLSFVKSLAEYFCNLNTRRYFLSDPGAKPLSPNYLYTSLYNLGIKIDDSQMHTFTFKNDRLVSSQDRFLINGRLFRCERIEYEIGDEGIAPLCKGNFYPEC